MSAEQDPSAVAIGDTFERVVFADRRGPWEVCMVPASSLLEPARWRRVRCL